MKQYLNLLKEIKEKGSDKKPSREGMPGTKSLFSRELHFDLNEGFPALTTKRLYWKGVVGELIWFLRGDTNIKFLIDNNIHIWDADALKYHKKLYNESFLLEEVGFKFKVVNGPNCEDFEYKNIGDLGNVYGVQWRNWNNSFDQIEYLINNINTNPDSRYHVVTAWNPSDFLENSENAALPACHMFFQVYIRDDKYLDLKMVQRSVDSFLGLPFNIASYSLLMYILCDLTKSRYIPGEFIWSGNDCHYYKDHEDQVNEILTREPLQLPYITFSKKYLDKVEQYHIDENLNKFFNSLEIDDFILMDYEPMPPIKAPLSVGV